MDIMEEMNQYPEITQETYLKFAQMRRLKYVRSVEEFTGDDEVGLAMLDPERQSNYLAALRDLEKQVLTQQKMAIDEQSTEAQDAAIAELILQASLKRSAARSQAYAEENNPELNLDPNQIPQKQLIPGEDHIGDRTECYREYRQRMGQVDD